MNPASPAVLQGLRVLELGQVLAGPFAGAIFADLGAEVVKLERVDGGDDARHMGPPFRRRRAELPGLQPRQAVGGAGPEDRRRPRRLRAPGGRGRRLHPQPAPRCAAALGIDGPALCARHPRLVYCAISAFGATRADGDAARLRAADPGLQRPVQPQRRPRRPADAQRRLGVRPGHRHVGRDRRAGAAAAPPAHRPRRRRRSVPAGNRAGVERAEGRCLQQRRAGCPTATARATRASCPTRVSTPPTRRCSSAAATTACSPNSRRPWAIPAGPATNALPPTAPAWPTRPRTGRRSWCRCCASGRAANGWPCLEAAGVPCAPIHSRARGRGPPAGAGAGHPAAGAGGRGGAALPADRAADVHRRRAAGPPRSGPRAGRAQCTAWPAACGAARRNPALINPKRRRLTQ
jgi:hypothetical protein